MKTKIVITVDHGSGISSRELRDQIEDVVLEEFSWNDILNDYRDSIRGIDVRHEGTVDGD